MNEATTPAKARPVGTGLNLEDFEIFNNLYFFLQDRIL